MRAFPFDLFEFEAVAPGDDGSPDDLVGEDDDGEDGDEAPGDGAGVAGGGGGLEVGAEAGEAEVAVAEHGTSRRR